MKTYNEFLLESSSKEIIVYHRSNELEHMEKSDFDLNFCEDLSIFGKSFYFSTSSNITYQLGKYVCKFKIKLEEPILDMNKKMTNEDANKLLEVFTRKYNQKIFYNKRGDIKDYENFDFNDNYNEVQYGEFFLELQDICDGSNVNFYDFIRNQLGYNSFKYYQDYGTNFITEKGDYGICYGIYNPKNIKFVDGPF